MTVFAIDPGTRESAYVFWDGERILDFAKVPNEGLLTLCREGPPTPNQGQILVVEMIGHYGKGMPAGKEVFDTCVWIGKFLEAYEQGLSWHHTNILLRATVKAHICGSVKAKDGNVRQALIDRFGPPGTKKDPGLTYGLSGDCWQAFAVAVTWYDQHVSNPTVTREDSPEPCGLF